MNVDAIGVGLLAPGYSVGHPRTEDAADVLALIVASDIAEFGESQGYGLDDLKEDWREVDPETNSWVVRAPDGALVGYLSLRDRQHVRIDVEIFVHPAHFGRGIGISLIRLAEARGAEIAALAPPGARVALHNWINALNADACALLEREGYRPIRYFWRMVVDLEDEPEPAELPTGFSVRAGTPSEDLRVFYETVEEAMADHWGQVPTTFAEWQERKTGAGFDPTLWFLAMDSDEQVGAAMCRVADGIGWIDTLCVRAAWRQRGLGLALVRHAIRELYGRGMRRVGLTVDAESPTGATRLYERAGMRVDQQYAGYGKVMGDVPITPVGRRASGRTSRRAAG